MNSEFKHLSGKYFANRHYNNSARKSHENMKMEIYLLKKFKTNLILKT